MVISKVAMQEMASKPSNGEITIVMPDLMRD